MGIEEGQVAAYHVMDPSASRQKKEKEKRTDN